jgi:poly-beta-1,6-N-acetyl-D-glucosamine synthase
MEPFFWILLCLILYTYLGYPLLIFTKSIFLKYPVSTSNMVSFPRVTVVIAARNEEENIERRIRNIMNQDYPKERLEVIIVSDGSEDTTDDIVKTIIEETELWAKGFLRIHSFKPSLGKPFCINAGVAAANGDFVVFTDCRQRFADNAIKELIKNFVDGTVGCVSGELVFEETPGSSIQAEMGAYWRFEKWLRKLESVTGSVPGATGAIYAVRKKLFRPLPVQTLLDDVLIPMYICMQGFRTIFESKAIAYDMVSMNLGFEKKRKIRTLAGNWQLLSLEPKLFSPFKNPIWTRFFSHKILRLLIPHCLIALMIVAFCLKNFCSIVFICLVFLFFLLSLLPPLQGRLSFLSKLTNIFKTLIFLNYFAFLAPFKLIFSSKKMW